MRTKPYTEAGIRRVPCARCGAPSRYQWQVCADGRQYRGICETCDIALNRMVLRWFGFNDWREKMRAYVAKVRGHG